MKVAVYTIALNEEQFVERWYNSVKDDADYLLIADTGSTDGTIEKARALGINVVSICVRPWRFDQGRNVSLGLVPADMDYCIPLDMDEIMLPKELLITTATARSITLPLAINSLNSLKIFTLFILGVNFFRQSLLAFKCNFF